MSRFKVGDRVVCKETHSWLERYVAEGAPDYKTQGYAVVKGLVNGGSCIYFQNEVFTYLAGDFELYKEGHEGISSVNAQMTLPTDSVLRKNLPLTTGLLDYFPLALAAVANASLAGNEQHNPNQPLFWDKTKSKDHPDCIARHLVDRGKIDEDGIRHSIKLAWRALALAELELQQAKADGQEIFKQIKT